MTVQSAAQRKAGLDAMIAGMNKKDITEVTTGFTQGWDIVASYSEKDINDNLKRKWEKSRQDNQLNMLTSIDIHTGTYDDETGDTKYSFRTLELGPPRIEFEGQAVMEPAVHLVLPVEGVYYQRSDQKKSKLGEKRKQLDISNPYDVRLSGIKLGSVKGKYETVMKPKSQGKVASVDTLPVPIESSKKTVVFREDGTKPTQDSYEVAWVVLDFPMDGAALNVDMVSNVKPGEPLHDQAFTMKNNVLGAVKSYFKDGPARIDVLEYALATIKNTPQFNGAITVDLTPVSFRFATYASSYQTSILSLFIHTLSGTDAGEKNDLQVKWMASWTNNKISPIPAGYTASLLINPGLALNAMLKAGLEKGGDFKLDAIKDNKEGGLSFSARYQRSWSVPYNEYAYQAGVYECIMEIWSWNKDLKGNPVSFKIYQKNTDTAPIVKIDWEFDVDNKWRDRTKNKRIEAFNNYILFMEKFLRTYYKLHTELNLNITITDKDFSFNLDTKDLQTKWAIKTEVRDAEGDFWDKASNALNNFVSPDPPESVHKKRQEWMSTLKPNISFNSVGLGFFLTTNLLNPGAKVIKLDDKILRIPRDIVLVGDVVQGTDLVKSS